MFPFHWTISSFDTWLEFQHSLNFIGSSISGSQPAVTGAEWHRVLGWKSFSLWTPPGGTAGRVAALHHSVPVEWCCVSLWGLRSHQHHWNSLEICILLKGSNRLPPAVISGWFGSKKSSLFLTVNLWHQYKTDCEGFTCEWREEPAIHNRCGNVNRGNIIRQSVRASAVKLLLRNESFSTESEKLEKLWSHHVVRHQIWYIWFEGVTTVFFLFW